jgi:hypothetical protein
MGVQNVAFVTKRRILSTFFLSFPFACWLWCMVHITYACIHQTISRICLGTGWMELINKNARIHMCSLFMLMYGIAKIILCLARLKVFTFYKLSIWLCTRSRYDPSFSCLTNEMVTRCKQCMAVSQGIYSQAGWWPTSRL